VDLGNPVEFTIAEMAELAFWITYSPTRIVGQTIFNRLRLRRACGSRGAAGAVGTMQPPWEWRRQN